MKRILLTLVVVILIGGSGVFFWQELTPSDTKTTFTIIDVVTGNVENLVTAQGTLEPKESVDVGAQVSGLIDVMYAEEGDTVQKGDLIAEIDPELYEATVRGDEAQLKRLQAQMDEQKATVTQARQKLERNEKLIKDRAISQEALEDTQTNLAIAEAQLISLEAQIEEAESTLERDKTNLGYTKIYAPINGTVVTQAVKAGQTINANQTTPTIVTIANLDVMTVRAQVAEADIMKIKHDMDMYFTTLGSNERRWQGRVRQVLPSPEEENDVVLYNVLVDVENTDRQLMTGMTTQMFFVIEQADNIATIPVSALGARQKDKDKNGLEAYDVTVLGADGQPKSKIVYVSVINRTQAGVVEGLNAGEQVIINAPNAMLTDATSNTNRGPRGMARL